MRLSAAKEQLCKCIEGAGVSLERPDAPLMWTAFREFCRLPFEAPFSALRFLAQVRASSEKDRYEVEVGRQFSNAPFQAPNWARSDSGRFYRVAINLVYEPEDSLVNHIEQRFSLPGNPKGIFSARLRRSLSFPRHSRVQNHCGMKLLISEISFSRVRLMRLQATAWLRFCSNECCCRAVPEPRCWATRPHTGRNITKPLLMIAFMALLAGCAGRERLAYQRGGTGCR
jgi:hypothetical protein